MGNQHRISLKATLRQLGVVCAVFGMVVCVRADSTRETAVTTTETLLQKEVPGYLLANDDRVTNSKMMELEKQGQLTSAIEEVNLRKNVSSNTWEIKALEREAFRLQYLKREFSVAAPDMLKKIQEKIPDATQADLDQWTANNAISWIPVDGQIRYFRREPGVLFRTDKEAKARAEQHDTADPAGKADGEFSFTGHLQAALDAASDNGSSVVLPMRYSVTHTITLKPGKVPAGEKVRCWMPFPREDVRQQTGVKLISCEPGNEKDSGDDAAQRTIYMEQPAAADGSARFALKFEYTGASFVPDLSVARPSLSAEELSKLQPYLKESSPHLLFTDEVTSLSRTIVGQKTSITDKAFAIWDWIDRNIPWCPEMEYAVMPNIVSKVLTERSGDCGTQALTFIALARAAGVPARWQSGWVMKPGHWNLHDWAEFYAPGIGWVPVDPSVGRQKSDNPAVRDYLFGHIDSYRMIANSDHDQEFDPPKIHPRSDPVDNQRGELEWSGGNLGYDDWNYDVQVKSQPALPSDK